MIVKKIEEKKMEREKVGDDLKEFFFDFLTFLRI